MMRQRYVTRDNAAALAETASRIRALPVDRRAEIAKAAIELVDGDREIPATGRLIFAELLDRLNWENGLVFSRHARLVEATGAPIQSVEDGIAALRRRQHVLIESTPAHATWRATLPALIKAASLLEEPTR